ncbi:type III pantothenate kinase [Flavobacterium sp.]|uniref:type III pantothenate kinase n=1 Tax=Flavobacterium sp. TaxID=239 RepID=UPI00261D7B2B|nr:type III pantothenate kinase [Flavobacterium sp.]MDD3004737.1 type III pantothenate kinase [Flavobacterium sp.]
MILAIDIGNTRIKSAVFENDKLVEFLVFENFELEKKIILFLKKYPSIHKMVVASVGKLDKKDLDFLPNTLSVEWINSNYAFPFINKYATPTTLGVDRMILASGAVLQFPNQNRLVIDAGTCITYDFINDKDEYWGGAISAGLQMRYNALNNFTSKLPLLTPKYPQDFIGNSTQESLHSGVLNGILYEIEGFINQYQKQYSKFTIILTGGDAVFLAKRLKNTIFANSNFLLESLNHTYQYKIKND